MIGITDSNQKIITNGLVLHLDAAQRRSYPTTGTTWTDLSGNANNGTLTNGPTYNSGNGGSIVFDGINDRIDSFPSEISGTGSKTVTAFIYIKNNNRAGICGTRPLTAAQGWVFTINRTSVGNLTYFHTGGSVIEIAASISINTWIHVAFTYSTQNATAILYKNGNQIGLSATSFSSINASTFNGTIGGEEQTFSGLLNGNISNLQIYNRALSDTEILQNYNAQKSRFGL